MDGLKKKIVEWKKWLIEDLQNILKEEIAKDADILFDRLWEKKLLKER